MNGQSEPETHKCTAIFTCLYQIIAMKVRGTNLIDRVEV